MIVSKSFSSSAVSPFSAGDSGTAFVSDDSICANSIKY